MTVESVPRVLLESFFVVATQNPHQFREPYPLPEGQLDRSMVATPMATRSGGRSWVTRGRRSSGGLGLRLLAKLLRGRGRTLFDAAVNTGPLPCRKAPERDEAGGRSLVEGAVRVVGGEFLAV